MASSGYGQQTPYDTTDPLAEITFIIRQMIAKLGTMKVVQVVAVHGGGLAATGTVDVMPLVSQIDGNNNTQPHGVVYGLPYFRIQGGTNAIICDPVVGDIGYVVVSDRDISSVKKNASSITGSTNPTPSNQVTPGSARRNDLADGVYVGGILNATPKQYIQFTATGLTITDINGNQIQFGPTGITVIGNLIVQNNLQLGGNILGVAGGTYAGALALAGDLTVGAGTVGAVTFLGHTHQYQEPTGGAVTAQTNSPTPGS